MQWQVHVICHSFSLTLEKHTFSSLIICNTLKINELVFGNIKKSLYLCIS